jgi:hypothetical protein
MIRIALLSVEKNGYEKNEGAMLNNTNVITVWNSAFQPYMLVKYVGGYVAGKHLSEEAACFEIPIEDAQLSPKLYQL